MFVEANCTLSKVMMPYREEPESQVEPPLHDFINDMVFPPEVARNEEVQQGQTTSEECTIYGNRDTTPEDADATAPFESPTDNTSKLLIEETQFVDVELDPQGTDLYDISPTTRRAMNNMVLPPMAKAPPVMQTTLLERKPVDAPDFSSFRFGVPPKSDSLRLNRPLPGNPVSAKHQEVSVVNNPAPTNLGVSSKVHPPHIATSNLPRRGELPKGLNYHKDEQTVDIDDNINRRVSDTSSGTLCKETDQIQVTDAQDGTIEEVFNAKTKPGHISSRKHGIMGTPFQEIAASLSKHTAPSHLPVLSLNSDSLKHPTLKQDNYGPSNTDALNQSTSNDSIEITAEDPERITRAHDTTHLLERETQCPKLRSIQKMEDEVLASAESVGIAQSAVKKLVETFGEDALASGTHSFREDTQIQETQHRAAPESSYDPPIPIDAPPTDTSQRSQSPLSCLDQNRSGSNVLKGNDLRLPKRDGTKLIVNRPLQVRELQPKDVNDAHDLQATRRSKVSKKSSTRAKEMTNNQATGSILPTVRGTISSVEMLQMVTVMANAEHERLEAAIAANRIQEDQLKVRNEEEIELKEYVKKLELENESLITVVSNFDKRARAFKDHCNEVVRAQKQLRKSADEWHQQRPHLLKQIREEVDAIRDAAEENTQQALAAFSRKSVETLKEARLKLDSQEQTIEVLKCDLNNRLLDLQRERRVAESLRKQLDENCVQHKTIKSLLLQHHANTTSNLDVQQAQISHGLDRAAEQKDKLDECHLLISGVKDSEAKTLPALEGLSSLVMSLSTTVKDRVQAAQDGTASLRKAGEEVLAELNLRLSNISKDCEARRDVDQRIESLVEHNATLKERVLGRERECASITNRLDDTLQELEACRSQLSSVTDKLRDTLASPPEDPVLRGQLLDLRNRNSSLNDQLAASVKEVENSNAALSARADAFRLIEGQINELQLQLHQRDAKISSFEEEREAHGQKMDRDSKSERMQMERDFQARLADDEARHGGIVSSLRRQIGGYENAAVQLQMELDRAQQISSNDASAASKLRADITVLEVLTGQQAAELTRFEEELHSKGEDEDSTATELCQSRERIAQYEKEIDEWRAQAQTNVSLFTTRYHESDERMKKADTITKTTLEQELNKLRGEVQNDSVLKLAVMRTLQGLGILGHARSLEEFALSIKSTHLRKRLIIDDNNISGNGPSLSQPRSPSQETRLYINPATPIVRYSLRTEGPASNGSSNEPFSVTLDSTQARLEAGEDEDLSADNVPSSSPIQIRKEDTPSGLASTNNNDKLHLRCNTKAAEYQPTATQRSVDDVFTHFPTNLERRRQLHTINELGSSGRLHSESATSLDKPNQRVIPDSQDEMTQNERQQLTRPVRRVAERKSGILSSPRIQEANRTVTRTKVTEYGIKMSNTYEATPAMLEDRNGGVTGGGNSSSPLSSPQSDFDFSGFLEEFDDQPPIKDTSDQQAIEGTQQTASTSYSQDPSRYRAFHVPPATRCGEDTRAREMPPPKGILKRTKSISHSADMVYQVHTTRTQSVADIEHAKVPSILNKTGGKKRLAQVSTNVDSPKYNPYNRIVRGKKDTGKVSQMDEIRNHQGQGPMSPTNDVYTVDPSTVTVPPLGSTRKRSLSSVEDNGHRSVTKLQRLNRL